jgi:hypothetical protein
MRTACTACRVTSQGANLHSCFTCSFCNMRDQALLAGFLLLLLGHAAAQGPCACSPDGVSGGVSTGRRGCAQHLRDDPGFFCMVINPAGCPSATPSYSNPGAAWVDCEPSPVGRKWGPAGAQSSADVFSSGGEAAASAQASAQTSNAGRGRHNNSKPNRSNAQAAAGAATSGGSAAAQAVASSQTTDNSYGGSSGSTANAASVAQAQGDSAEAVASALASDAQGNSASSMGSATASGGSASAYASADATSLGCGLAQAVSSATATASGVLPAQQHYHKGKASLELSATAVAQAQALAYSPGCLGNPAGFGCQLAQAVASAEVCPWWLCNRVWRRAQCRLPSTTHCPLLPCLLPAVEHEHWRRGTRQHCSNSSDSTGQRHS